jgi:hypothetical protein
MRLVLVHTFKLVALFTNRVNLKVTKPIRCIRVSCCLHFVCTFYSMIKRFSKIKLLSLLAYVYLLNVQFSYKLAK